MAVVEVKTECDPSAEIEIQPKTIILTMYFPELNRFGVEVLRKLVMLEGDFSDGRMRFIQLPTEVDSNKCWMMEKNGVFTLTIARIPKKGIVKRN